MRTLGPRFRATAARALPLILVVSGVAAFTLRYHEVWRDEANAMLEARTVPVSAFLTAMRIEGIPPLFHALLKLAGLVLPDPLALAAIGALGLSTLLFGTYRLLVSISQSPRAAASLTLAFSLTYLFVYELGVVVRQYTLGLGLALLCVACMRESLRTGDREKLWAGTLAGALATLTSAHSACVAGAGMLAFGLLSVIRRRGARLWWPVLLTLPCFGLVLHLAAPFPERVPVANQVIPFVPAKSLQLAVQALVDGVMPFDWWLAEWLLRFPFMRLRSLAFWGVLGSAAIVPLSVLAGGLRSRRRLLRFDLLVVLAGWLSLLEIIVHHYWGGPRHHLFLGIPVLVMLAGWAVSKRPPGAIAAHAQYAGLLLLLPWFAMQLTLSATNLLSDYRYPFSDTKTAARALPRGARVVTDSDWRSVGILFWRPDLTLRSPSWRGSRFRYIAPDATWHRTVALLPLLQQECHEAPGSVYFAGYLHSLAAYGRCAAKIPYPKTSLVDHPLTGETFDLFRVSCACVASTKRPEPAVPFRRR